MENQPIPINIGRTTDQVVVENMLGLGTSAKEASESVEKFNDVYFSGAFVARERLKEDEYKRRRAKSKAAKKARRKNRGN